jgi:phosphatidylglycerophosphatase A
VPPVVLAVAMVLAGVPVLVYSGVLVAVLVAFSAACVRYGPEAEAHFGKKDPGSICADETAGQCLPLLLLPASSLATPTSMGLTLGVAFVSFRIADILKLPPANGLQRQPAGWGVLLDDLVAGVQAMLVVQVFARVVLPMLPL